LWVDDVDLSAFLDNDASDDDTEKASEQSDNDTEEDLQASDKDEGGGAGNAGADNAHQASGNSSIAHPSVDATEVVMPEEIPPTNGDEYVLVPGAFVDVDVEMKDVPTTGKCSPISRILHG
jgi:hypothetical protein